MNQTTGKLTLVAVVLISGLFTSEQSTSAHSKCREVEGKWIDVYPGTGNVSTEERSPMRVSSTERQKRSTAVLVSRPLTRLLSPSLPTSPSQLVTGR